MIRKIRKLLLLIFLALSLIIPARSAIFAQDTSSSSFGSSIQQQQAQLQAQLDEIEAQIAQYQQELKTIQGNKNTLKNKISQLQKQQATLNLQIKATKLKANNVANKITDTKKSIEKNTTKDEQLQQQIGELLKLIHQADNEPSIYIIFGNNVISNFFSELENYIQISYNLTNLLDQVKQITTQLTQEKQTLSQQQSDIENLLSIQALQKQGLLSSVSQQNDLLEKTKGKETTYQSILSDAQKKVAEIKSRLYQLFDVGKQINFGQAVQIAQWASNQTGVRAAFLLAILTQESNLGKNVGTCNRPGDPPEKGWRVIMKPDRDQQPFLEITGELGLNPDVTPVSCPMHDSKGAQIGWGGAMGPAQFIPSTWMGYKDRVAAISGKTANPWDIRDAFIAAAIKLKAGGAGTKDGEWAAAMRYFSGSTNLAYRFYGDNVVALANQYQADIDSINGQ
jgi:membrane-bound lytic murein transglycosylase B